MSYRAVVIDAVGASAAGAAEIAAVKVVGWHTAYALCTGTAPHLESLHVLPDERGNGVGSALLRELAAELDRRGASTLTVAVVEQNNRARELYERLGAHATGTRPAPWAPEHVREVLLRWDDLAPLRGA